MLKSDDRKDADVENERGHGGSSMKRFFVTLAASTFALVLILGAVGFVAARRFLGPALADAAGLGPCASEAGFDLQGLQNLSRDERFGHFLGRSMKFAGASGTVLMAT